MSDAAKDERWATLVELCAAVVISLAAAMTSWVGFQAALWDGEQAAHYTQAGAARVASTKAATEAGQLETADLMMFQQWIDAYARDDEGLQAFYRKRFRPEFAAAFDAWVATHPRVNEHAPRSPFAMPQYHSLRLAEANEHQRQADQLFERGQRDNDISDRFVRGTVLLAVALFFGGISQTFKNLKIKAALVLVAFVVCAVSALQVSHLPTLSLKGFF
ncbi:MAG: hypothetical protein J7521_15110 [Caulobacter sp.]|nr:hypothetical protein [Caulobacter sp.]